MIELFKTGTYLTASNLNLSQLAQGSPGIISGAQVYSDTNNNTLRISSGIIKFDDGSIVVLDGSDYLTVSGLAHTEYYVYVIKYGEKASLEIGITVPVNTSLAEENKYVLLAKIKVYQDYIHISNYPSSEQAQSILINSSDLIQNVIYDPTEISISEGINDTLKNKYLICITQPSVSESSIYFGFIYPIWKVRNIYIKGVISSDTVVSVFIIVNGTEYPVLDSVLYNTSLKLDNYVKLSVPDLGQSIPEGTLCSIKIIVGQLLVNEDQGTDLQLYGMKLTN